MRTLLLALLLAPAALGAQISGYVYTEEGDAVEGATVRAGGVSATTNAEGAFVMREVVEGVVELVIEKEGVGRVRPLVISGDVVSVVLSGVEDSPSPLPSPRRGEGTVGGRVTVDGKPLANAPVIVGGIRVTTNAKGHYSATGLPATEHPVTIDERLDLRLRLPERTADLRKAHEVTVNLELKAPPIVRGRIFDSGGKPVARALVQFVYANRMTYEAMDGNTPHTMADGRFSRLIPESMSEEQVSVAVTPVLHSTIRTKPFSASSLKGEMEIRLPKMEMVRLRVVDRAGKPVPSARVGFAASADVTEFEPIESLANDRFQLPVPRTDDAGELVLHLAADTYEFAAAAEGFQTGTLTKAIAKPVTLDLKLERAAVLRGRVHRGDQDVSGVTVNVTGSPLRGRSVSALTAKDGNFELTELPPGSYRLLIVKQDELLQRTMDVEAPGDVDIPLPPSGTLRGRVLDAATGAPVLNFALTIEPAGDGAEKTDGSMRVFLQGGPDGTFTVNPSAGRYRVSAGASGYTPIDDKDVLVVADETTELDLPLGRGVVIHGRVIDESSAPVSDASAIVFLQDDGREQPRRSARAGSSSVQTAADGTFTISGIQPGEVQLSVRRPGYVTYREIIAAEGTMNVEVQLARGLSISGIVTRGGKPAAGAQIGATTAGIDGEHQPAEAGEDGRFTLTGLVPARYVVSAILEDDHSEVQHAEVQVDPTRQKEIAIALDPGPSGVIFGTVTGIPPAGPGRKYIRRAVMVNEGEDSAEGLIDDAGNYRIEKAPAGNVAVVAVFETTRTSRTSERKQVDVVPGQSVRVDLDLGGSVRVSGRISVEGTPAADAHVAFTGVPGMSTSVTTREDGWYEVTLDAPGRYFVFARADQNGDRTFQAMREVRGGESIDIDLHEQVIEGTVVDAATRQPIGDAMVTLASAAGEMAPILAEIPTDANGRFRLATASTGPMRLIAAAAGYAHRVLPVSGNGLYTFEMVPVPDLRVRVLDARTGSPLEAYILVMDNAGFVDGRPRRTPDRTAYLFSLAPGKYKVMVVVEGSEPKTVEVTAPGAVDITID